MSVKRNTPEHRFFMSAPRYYAIGVCVVAEAVFCLMTSAFGVLSAPPFLIGTAVILIAGITAVGLLGKGSRYIESKDAKLEEETSWLSSFSIKIEKMRPVVPDNCRQSYEKLVDQIRFSDPVSTEETMPLEREMDVMVSELSSDCTNELIGEIASNLESRNRLCIAAK